MRTIITTPIVLLVALMGTAQAQNSLQGAWEVSEVEVSGGDNAGTETDPQPSLYLFTERHYSIMFVPGSTPRPNAPGDDGFSDEEIIASFNTFVANSGTYETSGSMLTYDVMVARVPDFMSAMAEVEYSVEGNTLVLAGTNDAGVITRTTLTRLE